MSTSYIMAVAHACEYFSKGIDRSGPYLHVRYYIQDYSRTDDFINALVGAGTLTGPVIGGHVTRNTPHFHPLSPNLACVSASLEQGLGEPVLNAQGYPDYSGGALISAEYRPLSWDAIAGGANSENNSIDPSTPILYCTQELSLTTETYVVPPHTFKFDAGPNTGDKCDLHGKIRIPLTELTLTFHKLPFLPVTAIRNLRGKVNSTTFLGAPAGCVLFQSGQTHREFNSDGSTVQQVALSFSERSPANKWNTLPSTRDLTWYDVSDTQGNLMYEEADLTPLLQF